MSKGIGIYISVEDVARENSLKDFLVCFSVFYI